MCTSFARVLRFTGCTDTIIGESCFKVNLFKEMSDNFKKYMVFEDGNTKEISKKNHEGNHMKIAVTGGNGELGRNLIPYLLEQGHTVVSIDRALPVNDMLYLP